MATIAQGAPHRRARTAQPSSQFTAKIIKFARRPRLMAGDLVELCGTVLPGNLGRVCIIIELRDDGWVLTDSLSGLLDTRDTDTGEVTCRSALKCISRPENLYRLDNSMKPLYGLGRQRAWA